MNTEKKSRSPFWLLGKSGAYAILILGLVATLLPFFYIIVSSLKTTAELRKTPPDFFPAKPTFEHYTTILQDKEIPLAQNLGNSVFVSTMRVFITLFTSSFAGYIFANIIPINEDHVFNGVSRDDHIRAKKTTGCW